MYKSLRAERKIDNIHRLLEAYKSTLTLYFSHLTIMTETGNEVVGARQKVCYYEVPPIGVPYFIGRKRLLEQLDSCFEGEGVEGSDGGKAVVVVLIGMGGKTLKSANDTIIAENNACCRPGKNANRSRILP